ncbi:MAG: TRAP transporter large permease subunit [Rhodocyclales bacterium]|nr:TRAP transporter large permease subunit [Rhodocyclales bacterium]
METIGLGMFPLLALVILVSGIPAWLALIATALIFALGGIAFGALTLPVLTALPYRVIGLLEHDLLQALPLYVLMGVLLNHLPLSATLFKVGRRALAFTGAAPQLTGLGLGVLLAPMNGSVGASVAMLGRTVTPRLAASGVSAERSSALVAVASTFGVVVPPSLVLILLADTMMRAHTEAVNVTHAAGRIINTQDIFLGALLPAAALLALHLGITLWQGRNDGKGLAPGAVEKPAWREWLTALLTIAFIGGLLGAVVTGSLYAVEAAATGGVALFLFGLLSGHFKRGVLKAVLRDTMAISGSLFALLIGATTFTLVLRAFETDRWIAAALSGLAGGEMVVLAVVLGGLAACSFVLDAFEIIFVVLPVVMPPLLMRVPDATWVAVLTLLILQTSFMVPPFGYAILMVRIHQARLLSNRRLLAALLPYLLAQLVVVLAVCAFPAIVSRGQAEVVAPVEGSIADALAEDARQSELLQSQQIPGK